MEPSTWQVFYQSELQSLWLLLPVPALFLIALLASGRAARATGARDRFVTIWALFFAVETLLDPIATGPLAAQLDLPDAGKTGVMLLFVLLGDFRVFALVFGVLDDGRRAALPKARPGAPGPATRAALGRAALWTLIVPAGAWSANAALGLLFSGLPGQTLWLIYELGFAALALHLRRRFGGDPLVRAATGYVVLYYALWATADVLILAGVDVGWLLRVVPNQLYYAFWVPFVYAAHRRTAPGVESRR